MQRLSTTIVVVLVISMLSAVNVLAGGKKIIRPDELIPRTSETSYYRIPAYVRSNSAIEYAEFNAIVKLPVGKKVKNLTYYHVGGGAGMPGVVVETQVKLHRTNKTTGFTKEIATATSSVKTSVAIPVETNTINLPKVVPGYTYWVSVFSNNADSYVGNIHISY